MLHPRVGPFGGQLVEGAQRQPASFQVGEVAQAGAGSGDQHGGEDQVGVAHGQGPAAAVGLRDGAYPGEVGVPGDVDVAGGERVDLPAVVGEQHEVYRGG